MYGNGHLGQHNINANVELPGGRIALQKFRDRVFSSLGIVSKKSACPNKDGKKLLKANIFHNKRYSQAEQSAITNVVKSSKKLTNVDIDFVDWSKLKTIQDQIQKVADTDIYISGPGTGLLLSAFLPDGSVVVNLGQKRQRASELFPFPSYMEEHFAAASPHLRALYYDRCAHPEINSKELMKLISNADGIARSCFDTSNVGYDSNVNKSPISRAYTQVFNAMVDGLDTTPRYYYNTRIHKTLKKNDCDWAEVLVFETPLCMGILDAYGWDQKKYRQALKESLADNKIDYRQCRRRLDGQKQCNGADCVFSHIRTQIEVKECILHKSEGQGKKAVPYAESGDKCVVDMSSSTGVRFSPICNNELGAAKRSLLRLKLPRRVNLLKMDIDGHEWDILENKLPALWKEDDALLPDLISFKLHTKYASANQTNVPQKVVKDKGRDKVDDLFLLLSEMGYYVLSKNKSGNDPASREFVVARLNPKSASTLRRRLIDHGCKLSVVGGWTGD